MTLTVSSTAIKPMTAAQREQFERDGYLVIRNALTPTEVDFYREALDAVYDAQVVLGLVKPGAAMHLINAIEHCPDAVALIDHPSVFPLVWSVLGWNVHIYHSHLDVHPQVKARKPFRFE